MRLRVAFVVGVSLVLSGLAGASEAPKQPVFGSDVSIVSLPVFVVDKEGKAMRGLTADDFELLDDGKPARVVSFQYVDTTSPEAQEGIREAPAARRRFLLFFDMSFTDPAGIHRARKAAKDLIRSGLAPTDLAGVATFDINRGVRLVANFTEDRALLQHAVDTLGVPALAQISDPLGLAANISSTDLQTNPADRQGEASQTLTDSVLAVLARRLKEADEHRYRNQVLGLVGSLEELAKSLRSVEGRKQIVYFSAGFDSRALVGQSGSEMRNSAEAVVEGRIQDVDNLARFGDTRLRDLLTQMTRSLSSADCVIHSVDVTGLGTDGSLTQMQVSSDPIRQTGGRESLNYLAVETGGRFFKDTNDLGDPLREVLDMTSRYYILGYTPDDLAGPGRFHKLKVKVRRKATRVSHRTGYYERVPRAAQTTLQRKFEAAQLVITGVGKNDLHFSALCLPFPAEGERQTLGIVVQVPREELHWQAQVALEVYGYAVAADGSVQDHLAQFARVDTAQADPQKTAQGLSFYGTLQVPPGQYTLKLMIQEPESGGAGVQFLDVVVPPRDARLGFLLPPVVMDDPARWLGMEMGASRTGRAAFPFSVEGRAFLPRTSFSVQSGTTERLAVIAYEPGRGTDPASGIDIQSSVTDAAGKQAPAGALRIDGVHRDADGRRTYVLGYTPQGLAPGEYTLRIGVGESGSRLESFSPLRVAPASSSSR